MGIEPTKRNILIAAVLVAAVWLLLASSANAQRSCKVWQHGTVQIQTTPKTTHYRVPITYDIEFCAAATLVATEQAVDTGLSVTRLSAHSTQSDGLIVVMVDPEYVAPNGVVYISWVGISDDGQ